MAQGDVNESVSVACPGGKRAVGGGGGSTGFSVMLTDSASENNGLSWYVWLASRTGAPLTSSQTIFAFAVCASVV